MVARKAVQMDNSITARLWELKMVELKVELKVAH
jgi:hypothetical protein